MQQLLSKIRIVYLPE